jgi:hypothetical protein
MSKNELMALVKNELPTLSALVGLNVQPGTDVQTIALQEIEYLQQQAINKPVILECLPETVIAGMKYVIKNNLTFDQNAGLVYIKSRNVQLGGSWQKVLEVQPSADGLISIARQCGRVLDVDRPEVVKDATGKVVKVIAKFLIPSYDENRQPIAVWKDRVFEEDDFYRWRRASHKENSRGWKADSGRPQPNAETLNYANENYTNFHGGIDPEFARAKAIRHGLKKLGTNQNEGRALNIVTPTQKKRVVDPEADRAAGNDENGGGEYHDFEEVKHQTNGSSNGSTTVHVQTHEEIEIPNL